MARRKSPSAADRDAGLGPEPLVPRDCTWPVVLGLDPGTRALGYGAVVRAPRGPRLLAAGVLRADARAPIEKRLAVLSQGLERVFALTRPTRVVLERAFAARNVQSALRIGESRGIALAQAGRAGLEVLELAPATAKRAVAGTGSASKQQVAAVVARLLELQRAELPLDATDALALALAGLLRSEARVAPAASGGPLAGAAAALASAVAPAARARARRASRAMLLARAAAHPAQR